MKPQVPDSKHANESDTEISIEIPSRVNLVALVRMVVAAAANSVEALTGDRLDDLRWVASEATTNAIEANLQADKIAAADAGLASLSDSSIVEAAALQSPRRVTIRCDVGGGRVLIKVSDEGGGLSITDDVLEITDPERLSEEGGFGLPLIEHFSNVLDIDAGESGTTISMELRQDR